MNPPLARGQPLAIRPTLHRYELHHRGGRPLLWSANVPFRGKDPRRGDLRGGGDTREPQESLKRFFTP